MRMNNQVEKLCNRESIAAFVRAQEFKFTSPRLLHAWYRAMKWSTLVVSRHS